MAFRAPSTVLLPLLAGFAVSVPAAAQQPLGPPPVPPENPLTPAKAVLGKILFWDEQLSSDGTVACGTCHQPGAGGGDPRITTMAPHPGPDGLYGTVDDRFTSPGVRRANAFGHYVADGLFGFGVQATPRTAGTMIAAAYFDELFWDGRASSQFTDPVTQQVQIASGGALESQSLGPIFSDVEMADEGRTWPQLFARIAGARPLALAANLPADVTAALAVDPTYPELFEAAFGTPAIDATRIAFALASYQRTLIPDQSKFDEVMRGNATFTTLENVGKAFFESVATNCSVCHPAPLFANNDYHNLGLRPISEDAGRMAITGDPNDAGKFRTPTLRNISLRKRFFHDGSSGSLAEVLAVYDNDGGPFATNRDPLLAGVSIPSNTALYLTHFMNTLTDPRVAAEQFPFDRPTLAAERVLKNPLPLGYGAVAGAGGFVPEITAVAPPNVGNAGFRVGVHGALGGQFAVLRVQLLQIPGTATIADLRAGLPLAQVLAGTGPGNGFGTWLDLDATAPVLQGLSYDAQWWVRDAAAPGGISRSDFVRVTIE